MRRRRGGRFGQTMGRRRALRCASRPAGQSPARGRVVRRVVLWGRHRARRQTQAPRGGHRRGVQRSR